VKVEDDFTSGDYLHGFLRGTRKALFEKQRESITIGMPDVSAFSIGALIALYERAVGFYGSLVNINAYNQPGVEAGKKAATELLRLQTKVREKLNRNPQTADQIARALGVDPESVYHLLVHIHANDPTVQSAVEKEVATDKFFLA
jgi:glucose-6-phosphate isomerase